MSARSAVAATQPGGPPRGSSQQAARPTPPRATTSARPTAPPRTTTRAKAAPRPDPAGGIARGPAQTTPNGAVIVPPAAPTEQTTKTANACVRQTLPTASGGTTTIALPPPPGLHARLEGGTVHVVIDTGRLPEACRPRFARILVDDDDFAYPPFGTTVRLPGPGQHRFSITPTSLRSTPTIVQASLGIEPELRGRESRVAIAS